MLWSAAVRSRTLFYALAVFSTLPGCEDKTSVTAAASASASASSAPPEPGLTEPFVDPVDGDSPKKTVRVGFDWPKNVDVRVDTVRNQERNGQRQTMAATWVMNVDAADERRLIVMDDYQDERADKKKTPRDIERATLALGTLVPDMIVSSEGKFISVENPERSLGKMRDYFFDIVPDVDRQRARAQLDQVINPKTLTIKGQSEWAWIVENWLGLELVLGEESETDEMSPPGIGGIPEIRFVTTYRAVGMVPCTRGQKAGPKNCIRINGVSKPPPDQLEAFARIMFSQLAASAQMAQDVNVDGVVLETKFVLITEPTKMLPHYLSFKRRMSANVSAVGRGTMPMSEIDEQERRFRYPTSD